MPKPKGAPRECKDLDLAQWMLAWDSYSLAAVVVEQMSFMTAMHHKRIVMEIASNAVNEGYGPQLGVIYDRVARCSMFCFVLAQLMLTICLVWQA